MNNVVLVCKLELRRLSTLNNALIIYILCIWWVVTIHIVYSTHCIYLHVYIHSLLYTVICSSLSPHRDAKESRQSYTDNDDTMDMHSGSSNSKIRLHISNIPYEMKWQELKDLLREKGLCSCLLVFIYFRHYRKPKKKIPMITKLPLSDHSKQSW